MKPLATTNPVSHISITQASALALLTSIGAQVAAIVPAWKPQIALLIQLAGIVVPAAFLIANALHAQATATPKNTVVVHSTSQEETLWKPPPSQTS